MSNPNGNPNPDIVEVGKATQFGAGTNASEAAKKSKPWSIRNQVRYLSAQPVDMTQEKPFETLLKGIKPTGAQAIAAKALDLALKGDSRLIEYATDNIDGKLAQTNVNADLEAIKNMTDEQLDDLIANLGAEGGAGRSVDGAAKTQADTGTSDKIPGGISE